MKSRRGSPSLQSDTPGNCRGYQAAIAYRAQISLLNLLGNNLQWETSRLFTHLECQRTGEADGEVCFYLVQLSVVQCAVVHRPFFVVHVLSCEIDWEQD